MTKKKPKTLVELARKINGYSSEEREEAILELLKYVHDHPERKPNDVPFYV